MMTATSPLHWACRRGMLELDKLLGGFLVSGYPTLSPKRQLAFQQLLQHSDQELMHWLLQLSIPPDPTLASLIQQIRDHATSSSVLP